MVEFCLLVFCELGRRVESLPAQAALKVVEVHTSSSAQPTWGSTTLRWLLMDGRRRRWLGVDVYYADSNLGLAIRREFGGIGLLVFDLFLRGCKRNSVEGQMTYSSVPDFLSQLGISGIPLVDEAGDTWELDALWTLAARHKNVRRTARGRIITVRATRWERWQKPKSEAENTKPKQTNTPPQKSLTLTETMTTTKGLGAADFEDFTPPVDEVSEQRQLSGAEYREQCRAATQATRRKVRAAQ